MKKKRGKVTNKGEIIVDLLIPYCVIVLMFLIVIELFFHHIAEQYHTIILILDYLIVGIFVLDLYYKYKRLKNLKLFLKKSWLDIIAVFPFFLLFRVYEEMALLIRVTTKEFRQGQSILHEAVELQKGTGRWLKEATRLAQEAERVGKASRSRYFIRLIRPIARTPRLLKILPFYERPTKKHKLVSK